MEDSFKGQELILQERNLEGIGVVHPYVTKIELTGKVYDLWKKGQATQEDYKYVAKLCREKIKRYKAQL